MEKIILNVEGMGCQHCIDTITNAVSTLSGVESVQVDLDAATVSVNADTAIINVDTIKETIEDAGYDVK